jgi:hypothetical protein
MALNYVQEKFSKAVRALAVGRGRINERLGDACIEVSIVWPSDSVPEGLRPDVKELMERVTKIQDGEKGAIRATIDEMDEDEAVELAELILALEYQLSSM